MRLSIISILLLALPFVAYAAEQGNDDVYLENERFRIESLGLVEGGGIAANVVDVADGQDPQAGRKSIGQPQYGDISTRVGLTLGKPLQDWIESSLDANYQRKNGEVIAADFNRRAREVREFQDALLTAIGFPACDASSRDPGYLNLTWSPEVVRYAKGDGSTVKPSANAKQKAWLASNFKLTINGIDCTHVVAIDAFTVQVILASQTVGETREPIHVPTRTVFPDLGVTVSGVSRAAFETWALDFMVNGNNTDNDERTGTLIYLDQSLKKALLTVELDHVGIFSFQPQPGNVDRAKVGLYCEHMRLVSATPKTVDDQPAP